MKRKLIILLSLLSIAPLTACVNGSTELPDQTVVPKPEDDNTPNLDDNLDLPSEDDESYDAALVLKETLESIELESVVSDDFELETNVNGISLNWESTSDAIIIEEDLARVKQCVYDKEVSLQVSATHEEVYLSRVFKVVVEEIYMGTPQGYTALEAMDYISLKLENEAYYYKEQTGSSYGVAAGSETIQAISNKTYKFLNDFYIETESTTQKAALNISANIYHKAYFDGYNVSYNHDTKVISDTATPSTTSQAGYAAAFGITANSTNFMGYVINENTINSSSYSYESGEHIFNYSLNTTTATPDLLIQMEKYGGIYNLQFSSIELTMVLDDDWNIKYIDTLDVYSAKKKVLFEVSVSMTQELRTTFTKFDIENPLITLPDYSIYKSALS